LRPSSFSAHQASRFLFFRIQATSVFRRRTALRATGSSPA
jgi:hypothetical protein